VHQLCCWSGYGPGLGWNKEGKHLLDDLGIEGKIIFQIFLKMEVGGMDLINLIQDRVQWRVVVDKVINICLP